MLGDSLVLAVQVPLAADILQAARAAAERARRPTHYRVINAGVQGYGPVEDALFYERVAAKLQPDLVVVVIFVANDASRGLRPMRSG